MSAFLGRKIEPSLSLPLLLPNLRLRLSIFAIGVCHINFLPCRGLVKNRRLNFHRGIFRDRFLLVLVLEVGLGLIHFVEQTLLEILEVHLD